MSFEKSGIKGFAVNNQPNWKILEKNPISKTSKKRGAISKPSFCKIKVASFMTEEGVISYWPLDWKMKKMISVSPFQNVGR